MATVTNVELWNGIRAKFPTFASHTSKGTADLFTSRGYETLKTTDPQALDEFFELSVKVWTQFVDEERAKDPLEAQDFGESYDVPYGQIIQRLSTEPVLPLSPAYANLKNGDSPDPYVVYKPEVAERFFKQNFNYASLITMPDDYRYKIIFTTESGMGAYLESQILRGLEAGYIAQKYDNKMNAINAYLNSTTNPLKDSQKYTWDVANSGAETNDELSAFIILVRNIVNAMTYGPYTSAFNALGHNNVQDKDRLRLVVRIGLMDKIEAQLMANTYHDEKLNLPIKIVEVKDFGGLIPYQEAEHTNRLYEVYDTLGHMVAWSTVQNATPTFAADGKTVTGVSEGTLVQKGSEFYQDPNASVIGMIADKGLLFEGIQNPYTIEPIRNPRGRYTNMWASSPNNTVAVDALYNCAVISETSQA